MPRGREIFAVGSGGTEALLTGEASADVAATVTALREAAPQWATLRPAQRVRWLHRYRDWLLDHETELAVSLQGETGKPWAEANLEIPYVVDAINYYGRLAPAQLRATRVPRHGMLALGKSQLLNWQPYGVVGIITPWNFPLGLSLLDAVPALLAGATIVVKPSEVTPSTVAAAVRGWAEIGAPPAFSVCTGGAEAGAALVDNVDYVQFTGSTETGRAVARRAADRLIPCGLELGGKDAMIVLADADVERAANAAVWGAMANAGQMCTSVERVYVHDDVVERFVAAVVDKVAALRTGVDRQSYQVDVGPLITPAQLRIVAAHVDDALGKGACAVAGGPGAVKDDLRSGIYPPTVLVGVDHSMTCMRDETFGPVLPIMRFGTDSEAIELANDCRYGLSATIFSADIARAQRLAGRLDVGAVNINDVFANLFTLALPQGGRGESGIGTRNGRHAIHKFCRPQAVVANRAPLRTELTWYPYGPVRGAIVHRIGRLIGGRGLVRKLWR